MRMYDLILKKRGGHALSKAEIEFFVQGFVGGSIPGYQVSALMMAIFFQGMDSVETHALVEAMVHSGDVIDLSSIRGTKVDKHSTGGVGDKTSIVLGPLVASAGVPVAKLSGRGLGHTGGTLDKLEAFTGFSSELTIERFVDQVNKHGIAIAGQTANLVPADKKLYALRDVTATVENTSLIAGSIMSKKIAGGADAIVLDVKCGDGAFMKDLPSAQKLAMAMVEIGRHAGRRTEAVITSMEQPLGRAIGNSLEVREAIETLNGQGPLDLRELCLVLGARMLRAGGYASSDAQARSILEEKLENGEALAKLRELVSLQGGDPRQVDKPELLALSPIQFEFRSPSTGYIAQLHAEGVGVASMVLGAGRESKESKIDLGAGIYLHARMGDFVNAGDRIATLYTANDSKIDEAEKLLAQALSFTDVPPRLQPLVLDVVAPED